MISFKVLKESQEKRNMCTARATKVWLKKEERTTLYVELDEETEFITNGQERKAHFRSASPDWIQKQLNQFKRGNMIDNLIAAPDLPLEIICGDVRLTLKIKDSRYIISAYRDIYPTGWLIPGGVPNNLEELLHPTVVAEREAREEVLIGDNVGRIYSLGPETKELEKNIKLWRLTPVEIVSLPIRNTFFEDQGDAQKLIIRTPEREEKTICTNIFIDPEIASVSLTLYWEIELPINLSELKLYDTEIHWKHSDIPLNRPIRLTNGRKTVAIFTQGQNIFKKNWITESTAKQTLQEEF